MISVVIAKIKNVLSTPWLTNESFLVLQTKALNICEMTVE